MSISIHEILTQINRSVSHHSETPALDAQVLLAHCLGKPRSWVMAHPEVYLDDDQYNKVIIGLTRLEHGEPLPYVIGHWEFFNLDFDLTSDVLIPRPETELLVECALTWLQDHPGRNRALDVGTGCGCIGIALAVNNPDVYVLMTDISQKALEVAGLNVKKNGLSHRVEFHQGDLLEGIKGQFDLICANLPYIPSQMMGQLPIAKREPLLALDGGKSGTALIFRLLDQSRNFLVPGGLVLMEIEASQGKEVGAKARSAFPAAKVDILKDLSGRDRCLKVTSSQQLVHLCKLNEWQSAMEQGYYVNVSLNQEGFIHCSQITQILDVANRFYRGIPGLVLLWIDPLKISAEIRWETADGAFFPHIYGSINLDAITSVTELKPDQDGIYRILELPG